MKLRETISWLMGTLQRSLFPYFKECSGTPLTEKQKQLIQILEIVQVEKSVPKTATVRQGQEEIAVNVDVLIFAVGAKPDNRLQEELVSSGRSVVKVGDCIQPRNILESVREGFEAGNKID